MSLARVVLNDIGTLANGASARQALNDNFQKIEDEFKKVVYRDGSTPNSMEADLDMDSHRILNLADAVHDKDAVNKGQVADIAYEAAEVVWQPRFDDFVNHVEDELSRTLKLPPGYTNMSLPAPEPSRLIGWNAAGTALRNTDLSGPGDLMLRSDLADPTGGAALVQYDDDETVKDRLDALASGGGAALVGFQQAGVGAVARTAQDKMRSMPIHAADFGAVPGVTADQAPAIQAAINAAKARGGGEVILGPGVYRIQSPLIIDDSSIILRGHGGSAAHDGGTADTLYTRLDWYGGSEPMVRVFSPKGSTLAKRNRMGVKDLFLDCRGIATTGLEVISVLAGEFENLYVRSPAQQAYYISSYDAGELAEAADTQRCIFTKCTFRTIGSPTTTADGFVLTSNTPFTGGANTSLNTFIECTGQLVDGYAWRMIDADNNLFLHCDGFVAGSGYVFLLHGAYSNVFLHCGGKAKIEGTASGAPVNSVDNVFFGVDEANGTPEPVMDPGCRVQWHGTRYGWHGLIATNVVMAKTPSNALAQSGNLGLDTLRVHNTSQAGIALTNGTSTWSFSQDGSGSLRLLNNGGTGMLDFNQGTGVHVRMNGVGFFGKSPVTARPAVTGSRGGNEALASLLSALATLGLITDSTSA